MFNTESTLIVGYPGRLSRAFAARWPVARRVGLSDFDITDRMATLKSIADLHPCLVINCAAITDMALCERDPGQAWSVNVRGVRHLAEACEQVGALLVHFSSDYALRPVNEYAWTKRASEALAPLTIRVKLYDASHWAWTALRGGRPVRMLTAEFLNPISTTGVAMLTEMILHKNLRGVVAVGTAQRLSFWEVGRIWAKCLDADPNLVVPVGTIESSLPRMSEMYLDPVELCRLNMAVPTLEEDARQHWTWYRAYMAANNTSPTRLEETIV